MKSILDPSFRYTPSFKTDIKKTFAKARRMQGRSEGPVHTNVLPLKQRGAPKGQAS